MKKQIFIVHGGESYGTEKQYIADLRRQRIDIDDYLKPHPKKWKETLAKRLGKSFEVIYPEMPGNRWNNKYPEWKIWFEKFFPYLKDDIILVGHSLGGIFLAKYLAENRFPKKVRATILVAAPFASGLKRGKPLADFSLPKSLKRLDDQGGDISIYQSKDDPIVPFSDAKRYKKALPSALLVPFDDKGHFSVVDFPELVRHIRYLAAVE